MNFIMSLPSEPFTERVFYFVISFSSLAVFCLIILVFFLIQSKKRERESVQEEEVKNRAYDDAMRIMDDARLRSLKILEESQNRASKSIEHVTEITKEQREDLEKKFDVLYQKQAKILEELGQDYIQTYKNALSKERMESLQVIDQASEVLKNELFSGIKEMTDTVRKETMEKQNLVEKKLQDEYSRVEEEVKEYKRKKIDELNARIFDVVADVSEVVLGRSIDQRSHEKIISETLKDELAKQGLVSDTNDYEAA